MLTFYNNQHNHLSNAFRSSKATKNIKIATVDSFEGREGETIVISLVNTVTTGFVDLHRANVALSHVKEEMFLMGDREFWKQSPNVALREIASLAVKFPPDAASDSETEDEDVWQDPARDGGDFSEGDWEEE